MDVPSVVECLIISSSVQFISESRCNSKALNHVYSRLQKFPSEFVISLFSHGMSFSESEEVVLLTSISKRCFRV